MEVLRQTAITYYKIAPVKIRVAMDEFYDTMDVNKDGTISFFEFSSFMSEEGYNLFNNPSFFNEISTEMTNDLNWGDVVTLFYIMQSGRPLCDGCRRIIMGLYFTCETCFKENGSSFNLHQECLAEKQFIHKHANFIDNFALLHLTRMKRLADMKPAEVTYLSQSLSSSSLSQEIQDMTYLSQSLSSSSLSQEIQDVTYLSQSLSSSSLSQELQDVTYLSQSLSSSSLSQEIQDVGNPSPNAQPASILAQQNRHWKRKAAYKALKAAITIGSYASNAGCIIM